MPRDGKRCHCCPLPGSSLSSLFGCFITHFAAVREVIGEASGSNFFTTFSKTTHFLSVCYSQIKMNSIFSKSALCHQSVDKMMEDGVAAVQRNSPRHPFRAPPPFL